MCFSANADLAAGVVVAAVGADALRHARRPAEQALALLPVLLGAHLLVEAVVWWGLTGQVDPATGRAATWLYLAFALCVLPLLVPLTIRALEPDPARRRLIGWLALPGGVLVAAYFGALVHGPVVAHIVGHHIAYDVPLDDGVLDAFVYAVVTCGALLLSSHRRIVAFGVANAVAVAGLTWLQADALTSLWCAWAAITSMAIVGYLRHEHAAQGVRRTAA